jgi:hypothetical protein
VNVSSTTRALRHLPSVTRTGSSTTRWSATAHLRPRGSDDVSLDPAPEHPARSVRDDRRCRQQVDHGYGGNLAAPSGAYIYNWNILPIGQLLWLKELESYVAFPPMQDPASYNLSQVLEQVKKQGGRHPSE